MFDPSDPPHFGLEIRKHARAMFHDCTSGCDGSINTGTSSNRGLEHYTRLMAEVYSNNSIFHNHLSKGDFAVLCGRRAIGHSVVNGSTNPVERKKVDMLSEDFPVFSYGRPNHTMPWNNDTLEGPFPSSIGNWSDNLKIVD